MLEGAHFSRGHPWSLQCINNVRQLHSEPSEKTLAESVNFSITRCRRERDGVKIIDNDPLSPRARICSRTVGLETRSDDLAVFFHGRFCAPVRRMTKLLQLNGQGTTSLHGHFQGKLGTDIEQSGLKQAIPLDGGILPRRSWMIEIPIFQKEERFHQQRRNVVHFGKQELRLSMAKKGHPVGTTYIETRFSRLHIWG